MAVPAKVTQSRVEAILRGELEALRSGADARRAGRVPEYAQHMKERLLALGQTEAQAEAARMTIIDRFGGGSDDAA